MFGAFYIQITAEKLVVFATAEGSFLPLGLSGHETGLMIIDFGTAPGHIAGIAGMFDLEITAGIAPTDGTQQGGLTNIGGGHIFRFEGRVQVMFNTTLQQQDFDVPAMFRDLLPTTSPTHYTIFKNQPNLSGTGPLNPGGAGEIYIKAKVQGSITLFDVLTLTGFLSIGVGVSGANGVTIEVAGAASTSIQYIGTLSGDLHFIFFTDYVDSSSTHHGAGLVGRAHLALADGGAIPGVSIGGQVILEVNTFVGAISVDTFEVDPTTGLLVLDSVTGLPVISPQDIGSNIPDQDFDLRLVIEGHMDISIVHLSGRFEFVINHSPFLIAASLDADMTFGTFGGVHVHGGFLIDSTGLALSLSAALGVELRPRPRSLVQRQRHGRAQHVELREDAARRPYRPAGLLPRDARRRRVPRLRQRERRHHAAHQRGHVRAVVQRAAAPRPDRRRCLRLRRHLRRTRPRRTRASCFASPCRSTSTCSRSSRSARAASSG